MNDREKQVVDLKIANPKLSQTQAYTKVFPTNNPQSAAVQASRLFKKPNVQLYKAKVINNAKKSIAQLSTEARSEDVRLRASQDVLDRTVGKATQSIEVRSQHIHAVIDLTGTAEQPPDNLPILQS
jgi:hypothetical protein